jgi:O-antigen ligase
MSPIALSGAVICTWAMGSSTIGRASRMAAMNALRPAVTNAISLLSTLWCLPSCTITRTSPPGSRRSRLRPCLAHAFLNRRDELPGMVPPLT